jgi:NAD(P)-dependent dehydrogenase (short-subunit alcohol dehydrogenase family)
MNLDLNGKVAVVTGASKGIGLAVSRTLLEEGAHVVVGSRNRSAELDELATEFEPAGALVYVPANLMEPQAPASLVAAAVRRFGRLDVLVNNAGGPPPGSSLPRFGFLDLRDDDWRDMLEFNLLSAVRASRAAIPVMLERGEGAIVNVSSIHGRQPSGVNVDYGAAKAAMINLTKALAEEFGPQGIRVNGVCPGPVLTPWWTDQGGAADIFAAHVGADRDGVLSTLAPEMMQLTTGRLADPQEIADAVVFLASPRSASTVGTELLVDSGMLKTA